MTGVTSTQLRRFNNLQQPFLDQHNAISHWNFEVRHLLGVPGELILLVDPFSAHPNFPGEGRTTISGPSVEVQAKVILPLLLEAFVTRFDGEPVPIAADGEPCALHSWSTTSEPLARAVAARAKKIGVRSNFCECRISRGQTLDIADECWSERKVDIICAMSLYNRPDDGEENVNIEGC